MSESKAGLGELGRVVPKEREREWEKRKETATIRHDYQEMGLFHTSPAYRSTLLVVVQVSLKLHTSAKNKFVFSPIYRRTYSSLFTPPICCMRKITSEIKAVYHQ